MSVPQQLSTQRKLKILDPETMRDVTNDILQPDSQSDPNSVPWQSSSTSSIVSWLTSFKSKICVCPAFVRAGYNTPRAKTHLLVTFISTFRFA